VCWFAFFFLGCGNATPGSSTYNDAVPAKAVVLAQAVITPQNGYVPPSGNNLGAAIVYRIDASSYLARLQGLNLQPETGLQVRVFASSSSNTPTLTTPLRGFKGDQNYGPFNASLTSISNVGLFSSLCIFSTTTNQNRGCAFF